MILLRSYNVKEVNDTLWRININKISRLDGYESGFFKETGYYGKEMTVVILEFL